MNAKKQTKITFLNWLTERPLIFVIIYILFIPTFALIYNHLPENSFFLSTSKYEIDNMNKILNEINVNLNCEIDSICNNPSNNYNFPNNEFRNNYSEIIINDNKIEMYFFDVSRFFKINPDDEVGSGLLSVFNAMKGSNDLETFQKINIKESESEFFMADNLLDIISNQLFTIELAKYKISNVDIKTELSLYPYKAILELPNKHFNTLSDKINMYISTNQLCFLTDLKKDSIFKNIIERENYLKKEKNALNLTFNISSSLIRKIEECIYNSSGLSYSSKLNFTRMLYFSTVTITTLGFGDIVPLTDTARLWTSLESILGVIVIGLFFFSLSKRFGNKDS
jgi:hypothetical protein